MQVGTKSQVQSQQQPLQTDDPLGRYEQPEFVPGPISQLRLLWDHRGLLAKALGLGCVVGLLVSFLIPNEYQSEVQLMPPDNQQNSGMLMAAITAASGGTGIGALAGDLLGAKDSGARFVGILQSRTVQDRLVQQFDLRKVYRVRLQEDARKNLTKNTGIKEDRKSGIISITVTDHDPKRAAAIGQAYVDQLDRLSSQLSTSAAHRERIFLEERLKDVKQDLDDASRNFSQFASKTAAIDIKEQGRAMVEGAAMLQGQMIAEQSELKGLQQIYSDNNVRVRSLRARIAEQQKQLEKMGGKGGTEANTGSGDEDTPYPSIRELPLLGVPYADLLRRLKIQEVVFETLTKQHELAKVEEAKETPSVKVLDPADVPERKSFPPRTAFALLAGSLALIGAGTWVVMGSRWQATDSDDPGKVLAREIIHTVNGSMPWATPNGSRVQAMTNKIWVRFVRKPESKVDQ